MSWLLGKSCFQKRFRSFRPKPKSQQGNGGRVCVPNARRSRHKLHCWVLVPFKIVAPANAVQKFSINSVLRARVFVRKPLLCCFPFRTKARKGHGCQCGLCRADRPNVTQIVGLFFYKRAYLPRCSFCWARGGEISPKGSVVVHFLEGNRSVSGFFEPLPHQSGFRIPSLESEPCKLTFLVSSCPRNESTFCPFGFPCFMFSEASEKVICRPFFWLGPLGQLGALSLSRGIFLRRPAKRPAPGDLPGCLRRSGAGAAQDELGGSNSFLLVAAGNEGINARVPLKGNHKGWVFAYTQRTNQNKSNKRSNQPTQPSKGLLLRFRRRGANPCSKGTASLRGTL